MHLFLSPHLDDAVFSCGATIRRLTANRQSVLIVSVTAGDPPDPLPDNDAVRELHGRWAVGTNPSLARRSEDINAARLVGATVYHLPFHDCIYRTDKDGKPLYRHADLFGSVHPEDQLLDGLLDTSLPAQVTESADVTLYIPLGVGGHVDHQITRDWGLALKEKYPAWKVRFYEEYPYSGDEMATERALEFFMWNDIRLDSQIFWVSETEVDAKIQAIACYNSQISTFWKSENEMAIAIRQAMLRAGRTVLAERYWHESD